MNSGPIYLNMSLKMFKTSGRCLAALTPRKYLSTIRRIAMTFCTDLSGPQMLNPNDFSDPLTFPLAPTLNLLKTLVYDQKTTK